MLDSNILNFGSMGKIKFKNAYILLAPDCIESKNKENKIKNWHLFKVEALDEISECLEFYKNTLNCKHENYITIGKDKINIKDLNLAECKEKVKVKKNISSKCYKSINLNYYLQKNNEKYELQKKDVKYSLIKKLEYFTDKKQTFFYSKNEDTIRMLACLLGRRVCGTCIATLYGDNKKEDENDLGF